MVHDLDHDLAIGFRACQRRHSGVHTLDASLAIRERAGFFQKRCAGQHNMRELCRFREKNFLHHQQIQFAIMRSTT
jgi:hypothetical protein